VRQTPRILRRHRTTVALSLLTGLGLIAAGAGAGTAVAAPAVAVTFTGTVTQGTSGVAGAKVEVVRTPTLLGQTPSVVKTATATGTGTYTVTASVPAGTKLFVRATRDDHGSTSAAYAQSAVVGAGGDASTAGTSTAAYPLVTPITATAGSVTADIDLAQLGAVAVTLGSGLDDVALERLDGTPVYAAASSSTTTTRSFRGLYPGTYMVHGQNDLGWDESTAKQVTVVGGSTTAVSVTRDAPVTSTLTGTVTRKGKAQSKVAVNVYGPDGCLRLGTKTDKKGFYTLPVATGGSFTVSFASYPTVTTEGSATSRYAGPDKKVTVTAGTPETVNAKVKIGGVIKGKVTFAKSVKLATVKVVGVKGTTVATRTVKAKKPTYLIKGLRKGTYKVFAQQRTGKQLYAKKTVKVRTAKTTKVSTLTPRTKGVTLKGTFATKAAGSVLAAAFPCGAQGEDDAEHYGIDGSSVGGHAAVSSSGKFTIERLIPGTYHLSAYQAGSGSYYYVTTHRAKVKKGGSTVTVKKASTAYSIAFTGTVTSGGSPVVGVDVWVNHRTYGSQVVGNVPPSSTTGALTGDLDPRDPVTHVSVTFGHAYDDTVLFPRNSPYYYSVSSPTTVTKPADLKAITLGPVKGA